MGHITVFRTERRKVRRWDILVSEDGYLTNQTKYPPFVMKVGSEKGEVLKDAIRRAVDIYKTERIIRFGVMSPFTVDHVTRFGITGKILKPLAPKILASYK